MGATKSIALTSLACSITSAQRPDRRPPRNFNQTIDPMFTENKDLETLFLHRTRAGVSVSIKKH